MLTVKAEARLTNELYFLPPAGWMLQQTPKLFKLFLVDICGPSIPSGPITATRLEVVTPNFPLAYGQNEDCELTFVHPMGDAFQVEFLDFDVEVSWTCIISVDVLDDVLYRAWLISESVILARAEN